MIRVAGLLVRFIGYMRMKRVRIDVDYSKWLGPNYIKTYDGAGINICNHTSLLDTPVLQYLIEPFCSFLGKNESREIIGIS